MDVTAVIVTYQAERSIGACLDALLAQSPHGGALEILVVDGCSNDATQEIVRKHGDRVRLVLNPGRTIASNRNVGLREARYDIIAFTDADCVVPCDWLQGLCRAFEALHGEDGDLAGVGGCSRPPQHESRFLAALAVARDSLLGASGSVQGRVYTMRREVQSLGCFNVLYHRAALLSVGGFDESLANMCEDADINYRLRRRGFKLIALPGLEVEHASREDLPAWLANMYAYGVGRGALMRKHRSLFSPVYLLPLLLLPGLVAGTLLGLAGYVWAIAVWLYFPAVVLAGMLAAMRKRFGAFSLVVAILLGSHLAYGAGLWRGIALGPRGSDPGSPEGAGGASV